MSLHLLAVKDLREMPWPRTALEANHTWTLVPLAPGKEAIDSKWRKSNFIRMAPWRDRKTVLWQRDRLKLKASIFMRHLPRWLNCLGCHAFLPLLRYAIGNSTSWMSTRPSCMLILKKRSRWRFLRLLGEQVAAFISLFMGSVRPLATAIKNGLSLCSQWLSFSHPPITLCESLSPHLPGSELHFESLTSMEFISRERLNS